MSRFKVGDEVIVARVNEDFVSRYLLRTRTVRELSNGGDYDVHVDFPAPLKDSYVFYESELELLEIYNSPLYQALK